MKSVGSKRNKLDSLDRISVLKSNGIFFFLTMVVSGINSNSAVTGNGCVLSVWSEVFMVFAFFPPSLQTILGRFDEVLNSGNMALSLSQGKLNLKDGIISKLL